MKCVRCYVLKHQQLHKCPSLPWQVIVDITRAIKLVLGHCHAINKCIQCSLQFYFIPDAIRTKFADIILLECTILAAMQIDFQPTF